MGLGRAFWVLAAGRLISALGDGFFFPFTSLFLSRVHGIPPAQVGFIMSVAGVFSLAGRLPAGILTDRFGFKPVVVAGLVGAGLATMAAGFAPSAWSFALCYGLLSMMAWGSFPALLHGVGLLVPPARREEAFSILNLIANAAITVGPALGTLVVERDIRLLFLIDGLSFLLFAAIVWRWVPAIRDGRRGAATAGPPGAPGEERSPRGLIWFPPLSHRAFWRLAVGAMLMNMIYSQMGSTLPIDIESRFGPVTWYGLLWTLNGGMIALLQYPSTYWLQRYHPRPRRVVAALLYGAAALLLLVARPVAPFVLAFVVLTAGEILFTPLLQAGIAALAPPGQGGRYQAAGSLLFGVGWTMGPAVGGFLLGHVGHAGLWLTMAALSLVAAGVFGTDEGVHAGKERGAAGTGAPGVAEPATDRGHGGDPAQVSGD